MGTIIKEALIDKIFKADSKKVDSTKYTCG